MNPHRTTPRGRMEIAARKIARSGVSMSCYRLTLKGSEIFDIEARIEKRIIGLAQRERTRALREAAAVAHDEAIQNKAAAFRALTAGRSLVSEYRDSDGEACARVEERIKALARNTSGGRK